jgi:hypothetical protein
MHNMPETTRKTWLLFKLLRQQTATDAYEMRIHDLLHAMIQDCSAQPSKAAVALHVHNIPCSH